MVKQRNLYGCSVYSYYIRDLYAMDNKTHFTQAKGTVF